MANTEPTTPVLIPILPKDALPGHLPLLPLGQGAIFPGMVVPIFINQERQLGILRHLQEGNSPFIGIVTQTDPKNFSDFGVVARVIKRVNLPDGNTSLLINCLQRFQIKQIVQESPQILASVTYLSDIFFADTETEALARTIVNQFKQISQDNPLVTEEIRLALVNVDGPGKLSDLLASVLIRDQKMYMDFLKTLEVKKRLEMLLVLLKKELDVHNLQAKIQNQINENVSKAQREFFLNEQLKLIQKELGQNTDDKSRAKNKFTERLEKLKLSDEAQKRVNDELQKLQMLVETSPEYGVTYNYLDWVTSLPWGISAEENDSLSHARRVLQKDHYGLDDVKKRILEFIAVRRLKKDVKGSIICLVGPPGVGKTSVGRSIARALNRPFYRFSVGGMRDEAEIKGHRRTYVGALPGKIIQGLKKTGFDNPVFMIDEIDKLGNDFRGDPASALLEVLDPEQNVEFLDHYLDLNFDTSRVLFICTANQLDTIPAALLDRMEVIRLSGYILEEKLAIAEKFLIPKQLSKNGLTRSQLKFTKAALVKLIGGYAREAGVRSLEKWIEQICRKFALQFAEKKVTTKTIGSKDIERFIGPPYFSEAIQRKLHAGMAVGLAWTPLGGDTLIVESVGVKGKESGLKLTGQMGQVMVESANLAWTYARKLLNEKEEYQDVLNKYAVHIHVPAGAVPKDGPSAGITLATSLYGLFTGKTVKAGLAMTGELTLTGEVLPVGGIKEKLIASKRNGYKTIILPSANNRDLKQIPATVKKGIKVHLVKNMNEVLRLAFQ